MPNIWKCGDPTIFLTQSSHRPLNMKHKSHLGLFSRQLPGIAPMPLIASLLKSYATQQRRILVFLSQTACINVQDPLYWNHCTSVWLASVFLHNHSCTVLLYSSPICRLSATTHRGICLLIAFQLTCHLMLVLLQSFPWPL